MRQARRHRRYDFTTPSPAILKLVWTGRATMARDDRATIATTTSVAAGERIRVHVALDGAIASCTGHVAACRPASVDGALGFVLELVPDSGALLPRLAPDAEAFCLMRREIPVGVLNLGLGGCLVESGCRIEPGAAGQLTEAGSSSGVGEGDAVRVVRCGTTPGTGGTWRAGVEFVWTDYPMPGAMRHVAVLLENPAGHAAPF